VILNQTVFQIDNGHTNLCYKNSIRSLTNTIYELA